MNEREASDDQEEQEKPHILHIDLEAAEWDKIDVEKRSAEGEAFQAIFGERILDQPRALEAFTDLYEASFVPHDRNGQLPRCSYFLLGPSGVGKTESVRVFTDLLIGDPDAMVRLDASEYVEEHRVSQLLGAPAGYTRSNEFPMLSQYMLDLPAWQAKYGNAYKQAKQIFGRLQSQDGGDATRILRRIENLKDERRKSSGKKMSEIDNELRALHQQLLALRDEVGDAAQQLEALRFKPGVISYPSVLLIDEIEKAHNRLWNIVLQIMHGARLTVSFPQEYVDPELDEKVLLSGEEHRRACRTNFTNCYLCFTSNLGREEIEAVLRGKRVSLGFASAVAAEEQAHAEISERIYNAAMGAYRKRARSEFRGRIDLVLVYQPISEAGINRKLDMLLKHVAHELRKEGIFHIQVPSEVRDFILKEATEHLEEGIRLLEKQVRKRIDKPLRRALRTGELLRGDVVRLTLRIEETDQGEKKYRVDYEYDKKTRTRYAALKDSGQEVVLPRVKIPEAGE